MAFHLFSGRNHPQLSQKTAQSLSISLGKLTLTPFPDGELFARIEESVRGHTAFVMQPLALHPHDALMELLILIDALKRASAESIVATLPYFAYARQDRKQEPRVSITAKLVANLLATAGATRVLTLDLHAEQIEGFFDIPVDHLSAVPLLAQQIKSLGLVDPVVVAPDLGAIKRAHLVAKELNGSFAVIDKKRIDSHHVTVEGMVSAPFSGKDILIVDDMCSTGQTLGAAAQACRERGARRVWAAFTHGPLCKEGIRYLEEAPIEKIFTTDSVPFSGALSSKFHVVSVAPLFGEALGRLVQGASLSHLLSPQS